jgi:hypothetical protein
MKRLTLAVPMALTLCAPCASGETVNCTPIGPLPATITTPGTHCLTQNLATSMTSGAAITINAHNVTLDMNGWRLNGQGGGTDTGAAGIFSSRHRVTVKNGIIQGFQIGVHLSGRGVLVEDLLLERNRLAGIYVEGESAVVRRNRVLNTGGWTQVANTSAYGILNDGERALIDGNTISGLEGVGTGVEYGIRLDHSDFVTVRDNVLNDEEKPVGGGSSWAIDVGSGAFDTVVVSNTATHFNAGVRFHPAATGTYSRNVMVGCDTPYVGGTAGSGND